MKDLNDPTNVDTVPAMLTEGEFVLNKEATAMYGPLIEQMNEAGLAQRAAENGQVVQANTGSHIGYNVGGLVTFLKKEEGYRDEAYPDSGGVWTIGYGRTTNPDGSPVKKGQTTNQKAEDKWLDQRAAEDYSATKSYLDANGYEYTEGQLNSLSSFRYNGGQGMLESLTGGGTRDWDTIRQKMPHYNKVTKDGKKIPIEGLSNRREAELSLWNSPDKTPPGRPTTEVPAVNEVPPTEDAGFQSAVSSALSQAMRPRQVTHAPMIQSTAPQQPQYIPSVAEKRKVQTYNQGGTVHLNTGGLWNTLFGKEKKKQNEIVSVDPYTGEVTYANGMKQVDPNRAQIQATTAGPAQPQPQYQPAPAQPPQPGYEPNAGKGMRGGGILNVPGLQEVPPNVTDTPPVPGSDEAILQSSSQQVEEQEQSGYAAYSPDDFVQAAQPQPPQPPSTEDKALSTFQNPNATPEQVQQAQEDIAPAASFTQAVEQPAQKQTVPDQAPQGGAKKEPDAVRAPKVKEVLSTVAKEEPPMVNQPEGDQLVAAGLKAGKPAMMEASNKLKDVFGDLFDSKELARMAVVFAGALATGASPGQALSISGQMYLSRVDAKQATQQKYMNDLATGGKYTPASLQAYKESGDLSMLMPTTQGGVAGTGQYQDFYGPSGKITAEKVKVGKDQYKWVGPNGKVVDGRVFNQDPSNVRGTPEYRTRINSSTKQVEGVLDGLRSTFDKQGTGDETFYKTDVVPAAQAGKIAEWAAANNVAPEEMAGLVESAYHNAINDRRQDGARVRDLTPYLNQLVIRQSVGTSAEVFRTNPGEDGPPQYLDTEKMTVMNRVASDLLKSKGFKGGSQDLANQFYTAAITDWNKLPAGVKKDWERKANKGENGFYHFAQDYLVKSTK